MEVFERLFYYCAPHEILHSNLMQMENSEIRMIFFVQEKNRKKNKNSKDLANWWQSFWHMCLWPKKSLLETLQASWNDSSWSDCWSELIAHIRINLKSHTKVIDSYLKIYVAFEQTEHVQFGFKTSFLY